MNVSAWKRFLVSQAAGGWVHNDRLHGVLAVSRAFGDVEHKVLKEKCWDKAYSADPLIAVPVRLPALKPVNSWVLLLSCAAVNGGSVVLVWASRRARPQEISVETLTPRDEFLILACDGLWDVLTSQQVWSAAVVPFASAAAVGIQLSRALFCCCNL